jgi:glycerate kinase
LDNFGININSYPGSGAAGGIGGGSLFFLNSVIKKGIDLIFDLTNFDKHLQECDLVISGEGKIDSQTMSGKVVKGVV